MILNVTVTEALSMGTRFSTPTCHKLYLHWPIAKKFVTGDYVSDSYPKTKFGANPSTGGSGQMHEI